MASKSVYGSRQIGRTWRGRPWFSAHRGACWPGRAIAASTCCGTPEKPPSRTTRATGSAGNCRRVKRVCPNYFGCAGEIVEFAGGFERCGGSKTRRLRQCKISIRQVLISRTLSACGEVAERLKAAVCYTEIRLSTIFIFPRKSGLDSARIGRKQIIATDPCGLRRAHQRGDLTDLRCRNVGAWLSHRGHLRSRICASWARS